MKHLKKFENISDKNFSISEISDIINEFADSFEVEEEDIDIFYYLNRDGINGQLISLSELRDNYSVLEHIGNLFEINIPRSEKDYSDFFEECDDNIKIFEKLKSLNGKLETMGCEIIPNSFDTEENYYLISISKNKR